MAGVFVVQNKVTPFRLRLYEILGSALRSPLSYENKLRITTSIEFLNQLRSAEFQFFARLLSQLDLEFHSIQSLKKRKQTTKSSDRLVLRNFDLLCRLFC